MQNDNIHGDSLSAERAFSPEAVIPFEAQQLLDRLAAVAEPYGRIAVALSGGVDSSVLVAALARILRPENVLAVTVEAPMTTTEDAHDARIATLQSGVRHKVISIGAAILEEPCFRENPEDRCYHCKKLIFSQIINAASEAGFIHIADGTNIGDLGEYRPGLKALREFGVISPFAEAGMSKKEIRVLASAICPHVSEKPSMACLATRIPHGTPITLEDLRRIGTSERDLRDAGFSQVRVRVHGDLARVEIDPERLRAGLSGEMLDRFASILHASGFKYGALDLDGYRTGSVSRTLQDEEKSHG